MSTMFSCLLSCDRAAWQLQPSSARPRCTLSIHALGHLGPLARRDQRNLGMSSIGMSFCPSSATRTQRPGQGASCPTLSRSVSRIAIWS